MTPAEILAIIQLAAALEPSVATFANNMITAFSGMSAEDRAKALTDLQASLKPMTLKA
jgi:hypothetical protein